MMMIVMKMILMMMVIVMITIAMMVIEMLMIVMIDDDNDKNDDNIPRSSVSLILMQCYLCFQMLHLGDVVIIVKLTKITS